MTTWSYKELLIQQRKQSPPGVFSILTHKSKGRETIGSSSQISAMRLGINQLKSLLVIEKN